MTSNTDFQQLIAREGQKSVIIPNGKTQSAIFNNKGMTITQIETPSAFTATTLTFQCVPIDNSTTSATKTLYSPDDASTAYSISVAADGRYPVDLRAFAGVDQFIVICADAQGADRVLSFVQIPLLAYK